MAGSDSAFRLGRVMAALITICLVAEITTRVGLAAWAGEPFQSLSFYRWSPYGLVRNNPRLTSPRFKISQNGFRALREYDPVKPAKTFRVLLMGGSVLYSGLGGRAALSQYGRVSSGETVAPYVQKLFDADLKKLIENDPAFADWKVEVINAAVNFNRIVEVSSAYLEEYVHWSPDFLFVFGSINNFSTLRYRGDGERRATSLQRPHAWRAEFERLVNDLSLAAWVERAWRGAAEHSAAMAVTSKVLGKVANLAVASMQRDQSRTTGIVERELEDDREAQAYFDLYAVYADAIIAAATRAGHGVAFVWEPLLGDLAGVKPFSEEELSIHGILEREPDEIAQFEASRQRFRAHFEAQNVRYVDPTERMKTHDQTVFIDYGHYTPGGNEFIADVLYQSFRPQLLELLRQRQQATSNGSD